jgi:hypothetical protein
MEKKEIHVKFRMENSKTYVCGKRHVDGRTRECKHVNGIEQACDTAQQINFVSIVMNLQLP